MAMASNELYSFNLHGTRYDVISLKDASEVYCSLRDDSFEGASTFPMPKLYKTVDGGTRKEYGRIAYNGRIFDKSGACVYDL